MFMHIFLVGPQKNPSPSALFFFVWGPALSHVVEKDVGNLYAVDAQDTDAPEVAWFCWKM